MKRIEFDYKRFTELWDIAVAHNQVEHDMGSKMRIFGHVDGQLEKYKINNVELISKCVPNSNLDAQAVFSNFQQELDKWHNYDLPEFLDNLKLELVKAKSFPPRPSEPVLPKNASLGEILQYKADCEAYWEEIRRINELRQPLKEMMKELNHRMARLNKGLFQKIKSFRRNGLIVVLYNEYTAELEDTQHTG